MHLFTLTLLLIRIKENLLPLHAIWKFIESMFICLHGRRNANECRNTSLPIDLEGAKEINERDDIHEFDWEITDVEDAVNIMRFILVVVKLMIILKTLMKI